MSEVHKACILKRVTEYTIWIIQRHCISRYLLLYILPVESETLNIPSVEFLHFLPTEVSVCSVSHRTTSVSIFLSVCGLPDVASVLETDETPSWRPQI
jgi:hypothetical protein